MQNYIFTHLKKQQENQRRRLLRINFRIFTHRVTNRAVVVGVDDHDLYGCRGNMESVCRRDIDEVPFLFLAI